MKISRIVLISFFLFFQTNLIAYSSDPKEFVQELLGDVISKLSSKDLSEEEKKTILKLLHWKM